MTKDEVIQRLCRLCTNTNNKVFKFKFATDCICGENQLKLGGFQFDTEVLNFIEAAVEEKIARTEKL